MASDVDKLTFWEHLDALRAVLIRIIAVVVVCGIVAFLFKEELFAIVLAPKDSGFVTYRWLSAAAAFTGAGGELLPGADGMADFSVRLINTGLAQQFIIHMQTAMWAGVLCASPYILFQLFNFVSPALYASERRYAVRLVGCGYAMFIIGVLISYFLVFPLTFRFLGTYQVSGEVENMISLQSYISTLLMLSLSMGAVFEMPVVAWLLGRMGLLSSKFMKSYRRHAIVLILIVAAIITPTSDIFTLMLVSLPMWLLYEVSIWLVGMTEKGRQQ